MQFSGLLKFALSATVAIILSPPGNCADRSSQMTHVIIEMSGTDISADSFIAKPKTYWRASNQFCRVDEEPDPTNNIHGRMVIHEPDAWLVNLADNTGKHMVDPGPTFNCRLPIFAFDKKTATSKIGELEVGRELDFFRANGAKLVDGPKLQFEAKYYELKIGETILRLVERVDIQAPIRIGLVQGDKTYQARYVLWEEIPFNADLFANPTGVKIEEIK